MFIATIIAQYPIRHVINVIKGKSGDFWGSGVHLCTPRRHKERELLRGRFVTLTSQRLQEGDRCVFSELFQAVSDGGGFPAPFSSSSPLVSMSGDVTLKRRRGKRGDLAA